MLPKNKYQMLAEMIAEAKKSLRRNPNPPRELVEECDVYCKSLELYKDAFTEMNVNVIIDLLCVEMLHGNRKITCRQAARLVQQAQMLLDSIKVMLVEHDQEHASDILGHLFDGES